jgi:plasmid stabilization system protein ParE
MIIRLLSEAESEVEDAAHWYEERSEGLGARFLSELEDALTAIALRPTQPPVSIDRGVRDTRRRTLKHFPYSVVYEVRDDECVIIAVAHLARRPGYWRSRGK